MNCGASSLRPDTACAFPSFEILRSDFVDYFCVVFCFCSTSPYGKSHRGPRFPAQTSHRYTAPHSYICAVLTSLLLYCWALSSRDLGGANSIAHVAWMVPGDCPSSTALCSAEAIFYGVGAIANEAFFLVPLVTCTD
jgi:hypothetical protein